ncbi:unnamed protein product [Closterium sp. Yama58-4]|nr:unnamed protein product [Closterium sp. Yama58-4]
MICSRAPHFIQLVAAFASLSVPSFGPPFPIHPPTCSFLSSNVAAAVLTTAAASLGYPTLSQYLDILLPSVAMRWVAAAPVLLPLPALAQVVVALEQPVAAGSGVCTGGDTRGGAGRWAVGDGGRQMLEEKGDEGGEGDHEAGADTVVVVTAGVGGDAGALARAWKRLAPLVLPALLLLGRERDVQFLAEALQTPVPRLLKESFPHVVAALLPYRQSELDMWQKEAATRVLTTGLLAAAGWSEAERDQLLTKHMVPIITSLLSHTSSQDHPALPSFPTTCVRATICSLVDSTADSRATTSSALPSTPPSLSDHLNILRPANVFPVSRQFLLILITLEVPPAHAPNRLLSSPSFSFLSLPSPLTHPFSPLLFPLCYPALVTYWFPGVSSIISSTSSCQLLLALHKAAVAAYSPRHRCHVIAALSVLVDVLGDRVTVPPTFRYLVHILLACLPTSAPTWPPPTPPIASSQLSLSQSPSPPSPSPSTPAAVAAACLDVLARVVAAALSGGRGGAAGAAAAGGGGGAGGAAGADGAGGGSGGGANGRGSGGTTVPAALLDQSQVRRLLSQLASRATSLSPAVLAQSLESLCSHLAATKHLLWRDNTAPAARGVEGAPGSSSPELDAGRPGDGVPRPSAEALTATWQLLQVSRQLSESDPCTSSIRACLSRLLAALGIWDASAVSFKPPFTASSAAASAPTGGVTVVNADPAGEGIHEGVIVSVLQLLASLLVDPDVHAIQLAAQTIEAILMTERGHRVFTAVGFEEKQYLEAHIKTVNTARAQQIIQRLRAEAAARTPPLDDPAVWQAVGASHEEWVCRVLSLLILHAPDDILTLCAPLCRVNASLAALLLPHTLATLAASHAPSSLLCRTISSQLTTRVLQPARLVSPRTLQLLLDSLNALRACHTRARMAPPPTATAAAARAVGLRKSAAKPVWLQLDLLTLAQAAQHCGATLTAILYAELWCEARFGRPTLGEPSFDEDSDAVEPHEALLMGCYSTVNEPDAIYAVARTNKLPSRLAIDRHEGRWEKDGALGPDRTDFLELQYEAAWKMGKWDLPAVELPDSHQSSHYPPSNSLTLTAPPGSNTTSAMAMPGGTAAGFHGALYSALKALHDADYASSIAAAAAAQQTIVCQLASTSAESALHVNSRLVLLQALENVQEAAALTLANGAGRSTHAGQARHTELHTWQRQLAACGGSFELQEPLLSCRGAYLRASAQHAVLPLHLLEAASLCRKAHLLSQAAVHVQHLKDACRALTATGHIRITVPSPSATSSGPTVLAEEGAWAVEGVAFCGRVEEAKLLAQEGQQDMAVRLLQHLLRHDLPPHASQGSALPAASAAASAACVPVPDRVYTLGLAAKWLGETRSIRFGRIGRLEA